MNATTENFNRNLWIQWRLTSLVGLGAGLILFVIALAIGQLAGGFVGLTLLGATVGLTQWWVFGQLVDRWPLAGLVSFFVAVLCFLLVLPFVVPFLGTLPETGFDGLVAWFTSKAMTVRIVTAGGIGGSMIGLVMGMVKSTILPWPPIQKMGRWVLAQVVGGVLDGAVFASLLWTLGDPFHPGDVYFKPQEMLVVAAFTPLFCALFGPIKSVLSGAVLVWVLKECSTV